MARLIPNSKVAFIAPSSPQKIGDEIYIDKSIELLESWGLEVKYRPQINSCQPCLYLANSDQARLDAIHQAFHDDEIKAIFITRGGYGLSRIINEVHLSKNISDKLIIGYSDITALHLSLLSHPNISCIHGPVLASKQLININIDSDSDSGSMEANVSDFAKHNQDALYDFLFSESHAHEYIVEHHTLQPLNTRNNNYNECQNCQITGGSLMMIISSLATRHEIDTNNKVLFIEEVAESPYSIDRMLMHLKNAGKFDHIKGVFFGEFTDCESETIKLKDVLQDIFAYSNFPVAMGLPFGHGQINQCWQYQQRLKIKFSR